MRFCRQATAERVPVFVNVGCITTRETVKLAQAVQAEGLDVAVVITPYYIRPTQQELADHYIEVCRAVRIPVLAYNFPQHGGVEIAARDAGAGGGALREPGGPEGFRGQPGAGRRIPELRAAIANWRCSRAAKDCCCPHWNRVARAPSTACANIAPRVMVDLVRAFREGRTDAGCTPARTGCQHWAAAAGLHTFPEHPEGGHADVGCRRALAGNRSGRFRRRRERSSPNSSARWRKRGIWRRKDRQRLSEAARARPRTARKSVLHQNHNMHTNRLANEQSPYLLQHAHNPVDWYAVGRGGVREGAR